MTTTETDLEPRRIALQLARAAARGDGNELWEDVHLVPDDLVLPTFEEMRAAARELLSRIAETFEHDPGDPTVLFSAADMLVRVAAAEASIYLVMPGDPVEVAEVAEYGLTLLLGDDTQEDPMTIDRPITPKQGN